MVTVAGTVKGAGFDTGGLRLFGKTGTNDLGSGNVAAAARDARTSGSSVEAETRVRRLSAEMMLA